MGLERTIRSHPPMFLFGLAAVSLLALLLVPPIPQSQIYHGFADQRMLFGIPNFWNVASNLPFVFIGAAGLWHVRLHFSARIFFLGVFLTGFSSSYYHWSPDDNGLFWDRLPMSIAFMAILADVVEEHGPCPDRRHGIGYALPGAPRGGPVDRLEEARVDPLRVEVGRCRQPQ